jgi:hypothetical protein
LTRPCFRRIPGQVIQATQQSKYSARLSSLRTLNQITKTCQKFKKFVKGQPAAV